MAIYQFKARERAGALRAGELHAVDEAEALRSLEEQGLLPIRLVRSGDGTRPAAARSAAKGSRKRASARDLVTYTRQLETLLDSGVSLTQSLSILADQTESQALQEATRRVREAVEQGESFGDALGSEPAAFPALYVSMVRAGEEGGVLALMLERSATLLEHEMETRERVKSALFYPCMVLGELVLAFVVLMKVVMPRFASFYKGLGASLPLPTRILIGASEFIDKNGLALLAAVGLGVGALVMYLRTPAGRRKRDQFQIRAPLLGDLVLKSIMSRFARVLASLLASGLPITVALDIVRRTVQNIAVEEEISMMQAGIVEGRGITGTLQESGVFPALVVKMLAVGEETGSLDKMLLKVSGYFDRDVEYAVRNLTAAIEPILLVIMGGAVLVIALAVFLPMWNLMHAMSSH